MTTAPVSNALHFRSLDGLRGVAACLVMMSHMQWSNHLSGIRLVINGYLGVDLFFIMSGLVIAANYGNKVCNSASALRFMGLRFFRLYPLHVTVLGIFFVLECMKLVAQRGLGLAAEHPAFSGSQSLSILVLNLLLIHGLGLVPYANWNGASWSISCEFFAYLIFALFIPMRVCRQTWAAATALCLSAGAYAYLLGTRGDLNVVYDLGILRCLAGFLLGVLLWKYRNSPIIRKLEHSRALQLLVTCVLVAVIGTARGAAVSASIPLFLLLIVSVKSDRGPVAHVLNSRAVQYLGRISYSIYMVHACVVVCVLMCAKRFSSVSFNPILGREIVVVNPWWGDALSLGTAAAVLAFASVTYETVEEPGRSLGRRLLTGSATRSQAAPPIVKGLSQRAIDSAR